MASDSSTPHRRRTPSAHVGVRAARAVADATIDATISDMCARLPIGKSISPNDVARALLPAHWQRLLPRVRARAIRLAEAGALEILRKGRPVAPAEARGVLRLRRPQGPAG